MFMSSQCTAAALFSREPSTRESTWKDGKFEIIAVAISVDEAKALTFWYFEIFILFLGKGRVLISMKNSTRIETENIQVLSSLPYEWIMNRVNGGYVDFSMSSKWSFGTNWEKSECRGKKIELFSFNVHWIGIKQAFYGTYEIRSTCEREKRLRGIKKENIENESMLKIILLPFEIELIWFHVSPLLLNLSCCESVFYGFWIEMPKLSVDESAQSSNC